MNRIARARIFAPLLFALSLTALLAIACSTTTQATITDVWRQPTQPLPHFSSWVVFGGRTEETTRRKVEDAFTAALASRGVRALPSYSLFPGDLPNRNDARAALERNMIDGVLVATMRGTRERVRYYPGHFVGGFWGDFYGPGWGASWATPYAATDEYVRFETSVWDPREEGKMIWSAIVEVENPESSEDSATSLAHTVVPALVREGLVPRDGHVARRH